MHRHLQNFKEPSTNGVNHKKFVLMQNSETRMEPTRKLSDYRRDDLIPAVVMPSLFEGTSAQTWNALRHKGGGPAFVKVCRKVYYRRCDVEAWVKENRKTRTDQPLA